MSDPLPRAWALKKWISVNGKPDLAFNAGIAGSYNEELNAGDVVMPYVDCFADAGIEDGENFITLFEAGLTKANEFPYKDGHLYSDPAYFNKLKDIIKPVKAITVNTATGSETSKAKWMKKFNPDIETMEGATFFYICTLKKFLFWLSGQFQTRLNHGIEATGILLSHLIICQKSLMRYF